MGIFREDTELEKEQKKIIRAIKSSALNIDWKDFLSNYVNAVYIGERNNDFYENGYLIQVIAELVDHASVLNAMDAETEFTKIVTYLKMLLPEGKESAQYQVLMQVFLNKLAFDEEGFVNIRYFNPSFYYLFASQIDALNLLDCLYRENLSKVDADFVCKYALEVAPYCNNQEHLYYEVHSFLSGLKQTLGEKDEYYRTRLDSAKKRVGIYPLDEKSLALISAEAEKAQSLILKLEVLQKKVDEYRETVKTLTAGGKKEILAATKSGQKDILSQASTSVKTMQDAVDEKLREINEHLNDYLLELEQRMEANSNQVFKDVLQKAQDKIAAIQLATRQLSSTTTGELLRFQQATSEIVDELKGYIENETQLQEFLKEASNSEQIREALLQFQALQTGAETQAAVATPTPGILIPGHERLVVPANPNVIIPSSETETVVIPAFDTSIPFEERLERILREKERREANGEIFHEKTMEIIVSIMEGDWPYLWGPSGCGKSFAIRQIAELIGIDVVDNGKITDKYSVMAYNDPQGRFRATQAFVAAYYGKLLSLDEFDNGNTDTQVVLNELYSASLDVLEKPGKSRYVTFAEDMTVPVHLNFRMISAGNTSGEGENQIFSSRGKIDEAVQERMTPIRFRYDNRIEQRIFGEFTEWYDFFVRFRQSCDTYALREGLDTAPGIATTRDASAIVRYITHNSKTIEEVLRHKFIQTKSEEYLNVLMNEMKNYYSIEKVSNPQFDGPLKEASAKVLAKKFVYNCKKEIELRKGK